jgi:hypothetical protein
VNVHACNCVSWLPQTTDRKWSTSTTTAHYTSHSSVTRLHTNPDFQTYVVGSAASKRAVVVVPDIFGAPTLKFLLQFHSTIRFIIPPHLCSRLVFLYTGTFFNGPFTLLASLRTPTIELASFVLTQHYAHTEPVLN